MIKLPLERLKSILINENILDETTFKILAFEAQRKKQNIIDLIISQNLINRDYLLNLIAKNLNVEQIKLTPENIKEDVLRLLSEDLSRKFKVVPFDKLEDGTVLVAMEDPTNLEILDFLKLKLGGKIKAYIADDTDLNRGFALYERHLTQDFQKTIEESIKEALRLGEKDITEIASDLPIVAIVDNILNYAISLRASDIHIEVLEDVILIRYRIDGILREIVRIPKQVLPAIIARIKIISNLRVDEHNKPQDGRFRYKVGDELIDVRVSILPTFYGEKVVMRLLPASQKPLSFQELGMLEETIKELEEGISKSYGMILACGPTGAGKTTTLYSILNVLNRPEVNIVSIEDPIEYELRYVNQVQVNPAAGITFASGLRSILRQDPNIILVGEIRDEDTANISVQAALTGHLVLSSLHTNDAPTAVPRLIDMGVPAFLVAAVLNIVCAQRLARKIHLECIESYEPDSNLVELIKHQLIELGVDLKDYNLPKIFYRGKGCPTCNFTGYLGRIGIFEILSINEEIRKLIIDPNFNLDNLRKLARKNGMISMFEDGLRKVERGMTTIEEVFRVIKE